MLLAFTGNLSTGKSTLLQQLVQSRQNIRIRLELSERNPYLSLIDTNEMALLGFELYYLLSSVKAYDSASDLDTLCIERTLEENSMFAKETLKKPDIDIYNDIFNIVSKQIYSKVDGVIFLHASLNTIYRNMSRREADDIYTAKIKDYPRLFQPHYEDLRIKYQHRKNAIIINMDKYDIVKCQTDKETVIKLVDDFIRSVEEVGDNV